MTLACEDVNSKLVEVVTVADVEKRVNDSFKLIVQIFKLMFGHGDHFKVKQQFFHAFP